MDFQKLVQAFSVTLNYGLLTCLYNYDYERKLLSRLTCTMKFPTKEMYLQNPLGIIKFHVPLLELLNNLNIIVYNLLILDFEVVWFKRQMVELYINIY